MTCALNRPASCATERGAIVSITAEHLRPRDGSAFPGLHPFSLTTNDSNQPGKLLSLNEQIPRMEQMGFGHSSGTAKEQGRDRKNPVFPSACFFATTCFFDKRYVRSWSAF